VGSAPIAAPGDVPPAELSKCRRHPRERTICSVTGPAAFAPHVNIAGAAIAQPAGDSPNP